MTRASFVAAAIASVLTGCDFGSYTYKEDFPKLKAKAVAWKSDAKLIGIVGNGIGANGKSQQPSGAWGGLFFSPGANKEAVIQFFDGVVQLTEGDVSGSDVTNAANDANAFAAWPMDTDSPKWFSDAQWPTPPDVSESNIDQFHMKVFHCDAGACAFENNALVATEEGSSNEVEVFPSYRVVNPQDAGF
jgi:hypothetical protein